MFFKKKHPEKPMGDTKIQVIYRQCQKDLMLRKNLAEN